MMKKSLLVLVTLLALLLPFNPLRAEVTVETLSGRMPDLDPSIREHLVEVLKVISGTADGKFLLSRISPEVEFRARPMAKLGEANTNNIITLESLRLKNTAFPETTDKQKKIKLCFTAEITSHELLHNAQFQAGLFRYPDNFSGMQGVMCEKLLELQAKFMGERMFYNLTNLDPFKGIVRPKSGLWLVMQRGSKNPEKEYLETLWLNNRCGAAGTPIFKTQLNEISFWNISYTEQGFRNNYPRFLADTPGASDSDVASHLQKIADFLQLPVSGESLVKHAPLQRIPNGVVCLENGQKVLELVAVPGGYIKRTFPRGVMREQHIAVQF